MVLHEVARETLAAFANAPIKTRAAVALAKESMIEGDLEDVSPAPFTLVPFYKR